MLKINKLNISFKDSDDKYTQIIKDLNFEIPENKIIAIVGESGSGKSVTSLSIMGLLSENISKISGEIIFEGSNLIKYSDKEFEKIRGNQISMIFQNPMSSLNPSMTCGEQVAEILLTHSIVPEKEAKQRVIELFEKVKLPRVETMYSQYPHQLSGGQKQRIMIAMAIACKPKILIADEPTTSLDVSVQNDILKLLKDLQKENKMSIIFISHDLSIVEKLADTTIVMYKGEIVENNKTNLLFENPKHYYTKALLKAKPSSKLRYITLPTVESIINNIDTSKQYTKEQRNINHKKIYAQKPILELKNISKDFGHNSFWNFRKNNITNAVNNVSLNVYAGETFGIVGESGCGKSTISRMIMGLSTITKGEIYYKGQNIAEFTKTQMREFRKQVQLILQDPFSSLNPKKNIEKAILEPMEVNNILANKKERKEFIIELINKIGLDQSLLSKYPHELSGGQLQRVNIARAVALGPELIICDESVAALDVSVQAQVLNLLNQLKRQYNFTYIFISHDLTVVKYMADNILVMYKGKVEEITEADELFSKPKSEYGGKLLKWTQV
ncbi:MAG: ABC transporter ATP-binding protein [Flavobacteriaceae bacterium]|nr:ABC transporter ATP-binding protein [Flavobacteriaceae bacterium]